MMEKDRLIEIMTSALDDVLCGGCEPSASPYAYENGGSCDKCRHIAAIEIASIIRSDASTVDAVPVVRCKDCKHRFTEDNVWACPFGLPGGPEFFCGYGVDGKDGDHHDTV